MAQISSNGTGGGMWSATATWAGGVVPGVGDEATIVSGDVVYIDGDTTIGAGTNSSTYYALVIEGNLVWRNQTGDSSSNWTFTVNGNIDLANGSRWSIGTEDNSLYGANSIGPIPATRTVNVYFANDYYHIIRPNSISSTNPVFEFWGAEDYHQATPEEVTAQTVDSASGRVSFTDSARSGDAVDLWRGAWLEVTAGTNVGERREITGNTGGVLSWNSKQPMPQECDDTTVYTIKQNYHRALLTSNAGNGTNQIVVDRNVDWEVGDELVVGSGYDYSASSRPERVTISGKTDSKTYTITLSTAWGGPGNFAYDHVIGDMVIHLTKNIKFNCNTTASPRGYYFNFNSGTTNYYIVNWVFFDNAGYEANAIFNAPNGGYMPRINDVTSCGYLVGTTNPTGYFIKIDDPTSVPESYMLENIHVCNTGYIFNLSTGFAVDSPIRLFERYKFRHFSMIGSSSSSGRCIYLSNDNGISSEFYNIWLTGGPFDSSTVANGYGYEGSSVIIDGFRFYKTERGFWFTSTTTSAGRWMNIVNTGFIKNGIIRRSNASIFYFASCKEAWYRVQNVEMIKSENGIFIRNCAATNFLFENNSYDGCNYGLLMENSTGGAGVVNEIDGKYGLTTPNNFGNVAKSGQYSDSGRVVYISHNCEYDEPVSPFWSNPLVDKIFTVTSSTSWRNIMTNFSNSSTFEAHNPIVDGVPQHSVGIISGGSIVEILEHPTTPRTNSNIKLKINPFPALGPAHVNFRVPFLAYAETGNDVTISVWVRKNISQEEQYRPKLRAIGNGFDLVSDPMSDGINTWEKLTIQYAARFSGTLMVWLECHNNLKYDKDSTTDDAEFGEPADHGTVVVYADELDLVIVQ